MNKAYNKMRKVQKLNFKQTIPVKDKKLLMKISHTKQEAEQMIIILVINSYRLEVNLIILL